MTTNTGPSALFKIRVFFEALVVAAFGFAALLIAQILWDPSAILTFAAIVGVFISVNVWGRVRGAI